MIHPASAVKDIFVVLRKIMEELMILAFKKEMRGKILIATEEICVSLCG